MTGEMVGVKLAQGMILNQGLARGGRDGVATLPMRLDAERAGNGVVSGE